MTDYKIYRGHPQNINKHIDQIMWKEVENLNTAIDADLLLIFNSYYTNQFIETSISGFSNRIFEFLGVTQVNDITQAPRAGSFTSALIWALKELSNDQAGFTTSQLDAKILEAPDFPIDDRQRPCLIERGYHSLKRLRIAAVPDKNSELDATPR